MGLDVPWTYQQEHLPKIYLNIFKQCNIPNHSRQLTLVAVPIVNVQLYLITYMVTIITTITITILVPFIYYIILLM